MDINLEALNKYNQALLCEGTGLEHVQAGILEFDRLEDAIIDAEQWVAQFTKSDFMMARFYDFVKATAQEMIVETYIHH